MRKLSGIIAIVMMFSAASALASCSDEDPTLDEAVEEIIRSDVNNLSNREKKSMLKTANSNAKTAYNATAEYVADQETMGNAERTVLEGINGVIDCENPENSTISNMEFAEMMANVMEDCGGYVYVGYPVTLSNGNETFITQWTETDQAEVVGQYPDAVAWDNFNNVTWGYYCNPDYKE